MTNWDDIKKQARKAEEPLSKNAWAGMEQMLNATKPKARYRAIWIALAAASVIALFFGVFYSEGRMQKKGESDQGANLPTREIMPTESEGIVKAENEGAIKTNKESDKTRGKENVRRVQDALIQENEDLKLSSFGESAQGLAKQPAEEDIAVSNKRTNYNPFVSNTEQPKLIGTDTTQNDKTIPVNPVPAKPIGLPRQPWSSPSLKVFGVGSPVLTMVSGSNKSSLNYRWEIRAFAMATYNLSPKEYLTESPSTHIDYGKAIDNAVTPGVGFDVGLELKYRVFKHFKIGGGIEYRKLSNTVNYQYQTNKIPLIDSASGHILNYFESPDNKEYTSSGSNDYTFISIPISIYYEFSLKGKWSLGAEGIYNHSFLLSQKSIGVNPTTLTLNNVSDAVYEKSIGSAQFRFSLMYQLTNNLYLAAEPSYRQYLKSFDKSENINWAPRDLSVSLSVIYRFNNLK